MIWGDQLRQLWTNLLALGARRLAVLGLVGLTVFAVVGLGSYYLSQPEMEPLYSGLDSQEVARIGAALQEAGFSFDVNPEGNAVLVRPEQAAHARMLLAEKGLPGSSGAGYELFDKMGAIGLTSFMQEITRVRALEGEIARTIQGLKGVRAARVHIVMADGGSFRRRTQQPSASVVIRTDSSEDFTSARAIRHLVAAAVPGMTIDKVRVLSTDGTVLASGEGSLNAAPTKMLELERTVDRELKDNVRKTLAPYIGINNFELSVASRLNIDKRQINETNYDPDSRFERSRRTIRETSNSRDGETVNPVGVSQNLPDEQPNSAAGQDSSSRSSERKEELKNYEANSKTVSTVSEGYRVEALTVAVVINRKRLQELVGAGATDDAINAKLKEVEGLVASSVGADPKRGDRITVAAVDFLPSADLMEPLPEPGMGHYLLGQLDVFVKALVILAATIILVWFGLRPATRMLLQLPPPAEEEVANELPFEPRTMSAETMSAQAMPAFAGNSAFAGEPSFAAEAPNLIGDLTSQMDRSPQKRLEQMVEYNEDQALAILKQWLRAGAQA